MTYRMGAAVFAAAKAVALAAAVSGAVATGAWAASAQHNAGRPGDWVWGFGQGNLEASTRSGRDTFHVYCIAGGGIYGANGMEIRIDGHPMREPVDLWFNNGTQMRFAFPQGMFEADNQRKYNRFLRVIRNLRGADRVSIQGVRSGRSAVFSLFGSSRALSYCP